VAVFSSGGGQFWLFLSRRGDMLHRWGWNLAWRSMPYFTPSVHWWESGPCTIFRKFAWNIRNFTLGYTLKLKFKFEGVQEVWGFKFERVQLPKKFSALPSGKTVCRTPNVLEDVLKVLYHHTKFGGAWTLHIAGEAKKCWGFLFVCWLHCPSRFWTASLRERICPEGIIT